MLSNWFLPYRVHLVLGVFVWSLEACTIGTKPVAESETPKLTKEQEQAVNEARDELEIGRNMAGRLLKFYGPYGDEPLNRYINEVGNLVAKYSEAPDRRYMFEVYNSETVNAFACPGGYILISLGALKNAQNEAELAHVLAHEVTHVGERHMYKTLASMSKDELKKNADEGLNVSELAEESRVRRRPTPEQSELGVNIAKYISGSATGLNLLQAAKAGMSVIMEKGLGADLEFEADRGGTRYAISAGYQPSALINFLCRMEVSRGRSKEYCLSAQSKPMTEAKTVLDKTHPPVPVRVAKIRAELLQLKAEEIVGAKGKKRYMAAKSRIKDSPGSSKLNSEKAKQDSANTVNAGQDAAIEGKE